ncbi:MAG TPA: hypothetical protein VN821_08950 [Candidatus Udaeobacter sp.]|nr:hypothetical protein [Candidatus Udaeobacter sp.]
MRPGGILGIGLTALLRTVVAGSIRRTLRHVALLAALAALAGLALLVALAAAIAALWLWLSAELGPVHAALVMAAGFIALGIAMLLVFWLVARRPRRSGAADGLVHWLKVQSKEHQDELVLAAVLAGFVAAMASSKSSHAKPDGA